MKRFGIVLSCVLVMVVWIFAAQVLAEEFVLEWRSPDNLTLTYNDNWEKIDSYDMEGDGIKEIITLLYDESFGYDIAIHVYDGKTKDLKWSYIYPNEETYLHVHGFFDFDNDGSKEILISDRDYPDYGLIIVDTQTNEVELNLSRENLGILSIMVLDVDNDGIEELIVGISDGTQDIRYIEVWGTGSASKINNGGGNKPEAYKLSQNYPNPFNPNTTINYEIQQTGNVTIDVYDILGQKVRTLVNEERTPGEFTIVWDGKNESGELLGSGNYFYQLHVNEFTSGKRMLLLK